MNFVVIGGFRRRLTISVALITFSLTASGQIRLRPGQDVVAEVQHAPAGSKFVLAAGVYRINTIIPKDGDVFVGEGQAILNGSKVLEMRPDRGRWSAAAARASWGPGHCLTDHPQCWILNDLFIDDKLQTPVGSLEALAPGNWFYDDSSGKAFIGWNAAGHLVEFGSTPAAFDGRASHVQINHLIIEKFASPPQRGAVGGYPVRAGDAHDWTIINSEVRWNHGAGIVLGSGARVESCKILHNGQKGLGLVGANDLVLSNEFAYNNYAGYNAGWEAGATKFSGTDHLIVRSNYVHDNMNFGASLWTDIDNIHVLYEKNRVENDGCGIRHEVSYDAIIRNNVLINNKDGIQIANSSNVEVFGNVIQVPNGDTQGIEIIGGNRSPGKFGPAAAQHDNVHNNVIEYIGPQGHSGLAGGLENASNNTFDANEYHLRAGGDNHWNYHGGQSAASMKQQGFDVHSKVTSEPLRIPDPASFPDGKYVDPKP